MVSSQTLKLLDALLSGSSGSECEQLKALYKEAYCGTEAFKDLKTLLERSEFHGATGRELLMQSEDVLRAGFSNAGHFGDSLTIMEYLVDKIQKELAISTEYIQSATISGTSMHAVDKRLADGATEYYEKLFHYVCCFYASLYGASVLENIKIKTGIRSVDLVRNVNDGLSMLMSDVRSRQKPFAWKIVRRNFRGLNLVHYSGFALEYDTVRTRELEDAYKQITPALYVPKVGSDVLCCGIGYLTNLAPHNGGTVYGAQVLTNPALNCLDDLSIDLENLNISLLLDKIAGNGVCILSPETFVELLNRYAMIQTAKKNKERGCVFCGKQSCRHFRITKSFSM